MESNVEKPKRKIGSKRQNKKEKKKLPVPRSSRQAGKPQRNEAAWSSSSLVVLTITPTQKI